MPISRKVNTDFFKKWNEDMSYVLGFFFADGNMVKTKRNTHFISFYSADKEILQDIKTVIGAEHILSKRESETGCVYRLQIGSKSIFEDLVKIGCIPNKTRRLFLPNVPKKFFSDFVRGYFDGDGNVWIGHTNKNRSRPTSTIQVAFTSGSKEFLNELWKHLRSSGIRGGSLYASKTKSFARLSLSTLDALKLAQIMYNGCPRLYLKRKRLRFENFLATRV